MRSAYQYRSCLFVALSGVLAATASAQIVYQDNKLIPDDGASNDNFGHAIATDGVYVVVGSPADDDNGLQSGSAYVFDATTGMQLNKLLPADGAAADRFGQAVAIANGIAVVGVRNDDDNGSASGSVYLFDVATGSQLHKFTATDSEASDFFGSSVAIADGIVAVGAYGNDDLGNQSGSAYIFSAATGQQITKLLPDDGSPGDFFGLSIAVDNGIVLVGAPADSDYGFEAGSAYLFDAFSGQQLGKLVPTSIQAEDFFGCSVDIDGELLVIGAYGDDEVATEAGAAYLYDLKSQQQISKLTVTDATDTDWCGFEVSLSGDMAIIGSHLSDVNGMNSGAVYLFDTTTSLRIATLLPDDGTSVDTFAISLSLQDGVAAIGAFGDNPSGPFSGSAYLYHIVPSDCIADTNGDGSLTPADFSAWVAAFNAMAPQC
ncbi:MAG: FG-GAP repeat protein, partial [Phycisphaerales bacterium]|nr:FG-GAP repeat protein [Phycisphaerales bacterium]